MRSTRIIAHAFFHSRQIKRETSLVIVRRRARCRPSTPPQPGDYNRRMKVNFCSECGATVSHRIPPGDNLPRYVCDMCATIHYSNPKIVVGTLPIWEGEILLCRRAIEPAYGKWTLPAGFMENNETVNEAALRETREEACARVELGEVATMISVPQISQVHIIYLARLLDLDFAAGEETLELRLFREDQIPWNDIAFRTVRLTLEHYFADRRQGHHRFRPLALGAAD